MILRHFLLDERKGYVGKYYTKSNDCLRVVPRRTEMFLCLLFVFHVGGGVEAAFKGVVADGNVFHPFQQEAFFGSNGKPGRRGFVVRCFCGM